MRVAQTDRANEHNMAAHEMDAATTVTHHTTPHQTQEVHQSMLNPHLPNS
jgi:hypothetical protein